MTKTVIEQTRRFPLISANDLKQLGKGQVCYVRRYGLPETPTYVVHGADGTALAVQKDAEAAVQSARSNELSVVSVH